MQCFEERHLNIYEAKYLEEKKLVSGAISNLKQKLTTETLMDMYFKMDWSHSWKIFQEQDKYRLYVKEVSSPALG